MSDRTSKASPNSNRRIVIACAAFTLSMLGMSFAAVPLYNLFCRVTGYGGTTQRVEQMSDTILDRTVKVRFDANVAGGLGWSFRPLQREVELRIGETIEVAYEATNTVTSASNGQATFNVTPQSAGAYFNKVQCFCFTETELQPGESMRMPVVFFVDPEIVNSEMGDTIKTITLSYTFFPHEGSKPVAAASGNKQKTGS